MTPVAGSRRVPWWGWLLLGDAVFVAVTVWGLSPAAWLLHEHPALLRFQQSLDLGAEGNLAVWWSAAQILLAGSLFWERASGDAAPRASWVILAVFSFGLSADEVGGVHERLGRWAGWTPLLAIMAAGGVLLAYALYRLVRLGRIQEAILVVAGYALYGTVAIQEHLEHTLNWAGWGGLRVALEEGTELIGSLLVLLAAVSARGLEEGRGLRAILPRPERCRYLGVFLVGGFLAHSLVAILVVPRLEALDGRGNLTLWGNPALWFPSVVYGLLACRAYWAATESHVPWRVAWRLLTVIFLVASIGQIFDLVHLFPGVETVLPRWSFYGVYVSYFFLVFPVLLLGLGAGAIGARWPAVTVAVALPLLSTLVLAHWWIGALTPGWLAFVVAAAILSAGQPGTRSP